MALLDVSRAALVVIDMQKDFLDRDGLFARRGWRETRDRELSGLVRDCNRLIKSMREAQRPIIFVKSVLRADHADSAFAPGWRERGLDAASGGLVEGSRGAELMDGLEAVPSDFYVQKQGNCAFQHTNLDRLLTNLGVDQLVLAGGSLPETLSTTVRVGTALGYDSFLVRSAIYPARSNYHVGRQVTELSADNVEAACTAPPRAVSADEERMAMIVVDLYEEFLNLDRPWRVPATDEERQRREKKNLEIIEKNRVLAQAMRRRGWPVVFVNVSNRPDALDSALAEYYIDFVREPAQQGEGFLHNDTRSVEVVEGVAEPDDIFLIKKGHSAFGMTPLHRVLRNLGVRHCIVTGGAVSGCVGETVREGVGLGYEMTLPSDALYPPDSDDYLENVLSTFSQVTTTRDLVAQLQAGVAPS